MQADGIRMSVTVHEAKITLITFFFWFVDGRGAVRLQDQGKEKTENIY